MVFLLTTSTVFCMNFFFWCIPLAILYPEQGHRDPDHIPSSTKHMMGTYLEWGKVIAGYRLTYHGYVRNSISNIWNM